MVELIVGSRGTGKTKKLIDAVNETAEGSLGNVVCIEKGDGLAFNIKPNIARLIDLDEYNISGPDAYYGFISGLLAGNYDITHIFCDATYKIISGDTKDPKVLEDFISRVDNLGKKHECLITFSVSQDIEDIPEALIKNYKIRGIAV